jgi:hypothetical protein
LKLKKGNSMPLSCNPNFISPRKPVIEEKNIKCLANNQLNFINFSVLLTNINKLKVIKRRMNTFNTSLKAKRIKEVVIKYPKSKKKLIKISGMLTFILIIRFL